jgi:hypothetical protein
MWIAVVRRLLREQECRCQQREQSDLTGMQEPQIFSGR